MNITSTRNRPSIQPQKPANPPQQSSDSQEPKESYSAWTPFANAGVVGAAVAVPAAVGALATSVFPNAGTLAKGAMVVGASAALGLGAGLWAVKGAKEEFNGHPVLTAISGVVAGYFPPWVSTTGGPEWRSLPVWEPWERESFPRSVFTWPKKARARH